MKNTKRSPGVALPQKRTRAQPATNDDEPAWVCADCGKAWGYGMKKGHLATWHEDWCGVCARVKTVTDPRAYGGLRPGWDGQPCQ
jgi:hypothetical protein